MKVKKISSFVSPEDVRDGDIVSIETEGEWSEGKYGKKLVVMLRLPNEEEKKITLNTTSYNTLISEYGDDTVNWLKKEVRVNIVKQKVGNEFKDVIFLTHPNKSLEGEIIHE